MLCSFVIWRAAAPVRYIKNVCDLRSSVSAGQTCRSTVRIISGTDELRARSGGSLHSRTVDETLEVPEDLEWDAAVDSKASPPERLRSIPATRDVDALGERLRAARRPLILFGGGTRDDANTESRERLAEATGAAIFVTASGRGAVGEDHTQFCGLAGLYTARPMRALWQRADLIVVVASRMEDTATMLLDGVAQHCDIVQIDVEAGNFCHRYCVTKLLGDAAETVSQLTERLGDASVGMDEWAGEIADAKRAALAERDQLLDRCAVHAQIHIAEILAAMEIVLPADTVLVQENGLVDMWSYCYPQFALKRGQRTLSPGEQTTLGFGTAAALGVKLASPEGTMVVALVGDGAFDMYRADLFSSADHGKRHGKHRDSNMQGKRAANPP